MIGWRTQKVRDGRRMGCVFKGGKRKKIAETVQTAKDTAPPKLKTRTLIKKEISIEGIKKSKDYETLYRPGGKGITDAARNPGALFMLWGGVVSKEQSRLGEKERRGKKKVWTLRNDYRMKQSHNKLNKERKRKL